MKQILPILKLIFGWPFSILAIFFIGRLIVSKSKVVLPSLKDLNPPILLLAILCFLAYFFLRAYFWGKVLKEKGHEIPLKETAYLWALAEIRRYVPGNIWSFLGRTTLFSQKGVSKRDIFSSLLLEIQFFLIASSIISTLSLSFVLYNILPNLYFTLPLVIFIIVLLAVLFIGNNFFKKYLKLPFLFNYLLPNFSIKTNLSLLLIALSYMFFFSLGTYFAISSILSLSPLYLLTFIGLFSFSFLIGYLSLITPMGLGVREGVITIGLTKFISLNLAGFAAVLARVALVFSELIFLALIIFWRNVKNRLILKIEKYIQTNPYQCALGILIAVYIVYFTTASFFRYDNFYTGRFDLGNMDQTVWNTTKGRIFQLTDPNGTENISRLAIHADFILILIAPLYKLWSDPRMLLLLQTVIVILGAIFIFKIASFVLKNENLAFLFSLGFLINPSVNHANLYDFHAVTLATTFLLGTTYFFLKKQYLLFLAFAILSAITKEQVWAIISFFGLYLFFPAFVESFKRGLLTKSLLGRQILGLAIFGLSLFVFYYLIWVAIPNARGQTHFALSYYSDFGGMPSDVVKNIFFSPQKTVGILLQNGRLYYLLQLFAPLGFLSIFSPLFLVFAFPDLIINLLSNNSQLRQIYFQYTATIAPFLFVSAIYGLKNIKKISHKIYPFAICYLLFAVFYSAYLFGPFPGAKSPNIDMFTKPQPNKELIDDFLMKIPKKYSIAATNNLGSHLSHRQKIFTIPVGIDEADIVVFLLNDPFAQPSLAAQKKTAADLKHNKNYIEIFKQGDFVVFEKRNLYLESPPKINKVKLSPISIPTLQHRDYAGGEVVIEKRIEGSKLFTSYIVSYPSDGLKLYALMNVPNGKKSKNGFPVLIINHGYINPKLYNSVSSYQTITDYFSSNGFLVLKPDYRGNGNSEIDNSALMRFYYPADVLNLISAANSIKEADPNNIFLWGHSMGGEVVLKTLEVIGKNEEFANKIKAAVLWAPITDPLKWFEKSNLATLPEARITPYPYKKTFEILGTPQKNPSLWKSLSPLSYISDINIPLQINHGTSDQTVSYNWSIELYDDLLSLNKKAKLILYPEDNHNLSHSWSRAVKSDLEFFQRY